MQQAGFSSLASYELALPDYPTPKRDLLLHEVYCDEDGRPNGYNEQPARFGADADEGAAAIVESLRMALSDVTNRPILDMTDCGGLSQQP